MECCASRITIAHSPGPAPAKTFAVYAGVVICFGGLIFAGIRMMSGRFQFTAPSKELDVVNRQLAIIQKIDDGHVIAKLDGPAERIVTFEASKMRHFDHGYAVTSQSSQGIPAERALVNMDRAVAGIWSRSDSACGGSVHPDSPGIYRFGAGTK
jgi:hypothetical protein